MPDFSLVILYVDNPPASAAFYADLLGSPPIEDSPTFAMFPLGADTMIGLWSRHTVEPSAQALGGGAEVAFKVADAQTVLAVYEDWRARGVAIAQAPLEMDFGHTFVALDPDGHRLRVYAPSGA